MGDYMCYHCNDLGNCYRCSQSFEPDRVHAACGHKWRDHERKSAGPHYPGYSVCPATTEGEGTP